MKKFRNSSYLFLVFFIACSYLLYGSVVTRYFVSDDFNVLYRVCIERIIFIQRFFRPLSDLTIYLNYRMDGLNPIVFNSFNILVHSVNAYLVFLCCFHLGHTMDKKLRYPFALFASLTFISYPFHNEAVVWILGRGASMACLLSLLAILCFYKIKKRLPQVVAVCLFYFISMLAFESTMVFPFIFLLVLVFENQNRQSMTRWSALLLLTLFIHLLLRINISGTVLGSYGSDFFHNGVKIYLLNIIKVFGRLIFPPSSNAKVFSALVLMLIAAIIVLAGKNYRKKGNSVFCREILLLTGMLIIACIIPVVTGISTQTSESDRMLYFPSVFLSMLTGYGVVVLIKKSGLKIMLMAGIIIYNLYYLEQNNRNWEKASHITYSIIDKIQTENTTGRIFFLNIPNEINGAYVFRHGFADALELFGKDSNRFIAVNYLPRQDLEKMKTEIRLDNRAPVVVLPPDILMKQDSTGCRQIYDHGVLSYTMHPGDQIYFWNVDRLENIQACPPRVR